MTIEEAEALLHTEYKIYAHANTGKTHLACDEYSVPLDLRDHIDFITPTVQFDAIVKTRPRKRDGGDPDGHGKAGSKPVHGSKKGASISASVLSETMRKNSTINCNTYVTPDCLRALYKFPHGLHKK